MEKSSITATKTGVFEIRKKLLKKVLTKREFYDILTGYKEAELSALTYEAIALHGQ